MADSQPQFLTGELPNLTDRRAREWNAAALAMGVHPLECKAVYVAGLVRHLAESAGLCLDEHRHLAAYLLTADAVEALGASLGKPQRGETEVLGDGLAFISSAPDAGTHRTILTTRVGAYTIGDCMALRGFAAHGGRSGPSELVLDTELTVGLLHLLVAGLDRWWADLKSEQPGTRQLLASAAVMPLATDGELVFVHDLWGALACGALPGGKLLNESWRHQPPLTGRRT